MRVLVTGGAGQLGQALRAYSLQNAGLDDLRLTFMDIAPTEHGDIRYGDVTDAETIREALDGHQVVVHAAALHGKHVREYDSQKFLQVNVQGTANVLDACLAAGVPHVVLMSSTSVYGLSAALPFRETAWVDEDSPCQPRDINDLCKVLCEQVAEYAVRRHGLAVTVLRSGRFFVGDWLDFNLAKLAGGVDESDVAQAIVRALLKRPPGLRTYCISSLARFTRDDLPRLSWAADRLIEERYPGCTEALAAARRRVPVRLHRVVDISRARDELGYEPSGNFDSFIAQLLAESSPMVRGTKLGVA